MSMTEEEMKVKIRSLEEDVQNRHRQVVTLTEQVDELKHQIENNAQVVELTEKVKMLETQNLKLIEKNQSDVVQWRTKEKEFNQKISGLQESLTKTEQALNEAKELNVQLMNKGDDGQLELKQYYEKLLSEKNAELEEKAKSIQEFQTQNNELKGQVEQDSEKLKLLDDKLSTLESQLSQSDKLNQRINGLEQQIDELDNEKKQIKSQYEEQVTDLQNQITQFKSQLNANQTDFEEQQKNRDLLQTQFTNISAQLEQKEKQNQSLQNQLKESQQQYKDEMIKLMEINDKLKEKFSFEQEQYKKKMQEKDEIYAQAKHQFEAANNNFKKQLIKIQNKENSDTLNQLQVVTNKLKESQKKNQELEQKIKELEMKVQDTNKQYIKQLEHSKQLDLEIKKYIQQIAKLQEQMSAKEEDYNKASLVKLRLLQENQELKQKLEHYLSINQKQRTNELSNLKNQILEKDEEIKLLNSQTKSLSIQLKTSQGYANRFKSRCKQLETQNAELITNNNKLQDLFQEILSSNKSRSMLNKNLSQVSNNPNYQMSLLTNRRNYQEGGESNSQEPRSASQKSANTTPNKVSKNGEINFKRAVIVSASHKPKSKSSQQVSQDKLAKGSELNSIQEQEENSKQQQQIQQQQVEETDVKKDDQNLVQEKNDIDLNQDQDQTAKLQQQEQSKQDISKEDISKQEVSQSKILEQSKDDKYDEEFLEEDLS